MHNTSSDSSDLRTWYNRDNPSADAGDLLNDMRFGDWSGYCLAHLFTDRDFATGLLGLANIASPFAGQTGGICSRGRFEHLSLYGQVSCTLSLCYQFVLKCNAKCKSMCERIQQVGIYHHCFLHSQFCILVPCCNIMSSSMNPHQSLIKCMQWLACVCKIVYCVGGHSKCVAKLWHLLCVNLYSQMLC